MCKEKGKGLDLGIPVKGAQHRFTAESAATLIVYPLPACASTAGTQEDFSIIKLLLAPTAEVHFGWCISGDYFIGKNRNPAQAGLSRKGEQGRESENKLTPTLGNQEYSNSRHDWVQGPK